MMFVSVKQISEFICRSSLAVVCVHSLLVWCGEKEVKQTDDKVFNCNHTLVFHLITFYINSSRKSLQGWTIYCHVL